MPEILDQIARIALAGLLGAAVGLERELRNKTAGVRTNSLVALGAALFAVLDQELAGPENRTRIIAQVVTGIGFLGGGAILQRRGEVQGLTTAAAMWAVAAIGLTAGAGRYALAMLATLTTLAVLVALVPVDRFVDRRWAGRAAAADRDRPRVDDENEE
jgi:putative Mg2+ transporter-C (MgtC) family protein